MVINYLFKKFLKTFCFLFITIILLSSQSELKAQGLAGKEFVIGFLENYTESDTKYQISIVSDKFTKVIVEVPHINYSDTLNLLAGKAQIVDLKASQFNNSNYTTKVYQPIYIKSNEKVRVLGLNYLDFSTDASTFLPVSSLGTFYSINNYQSQYGNLIKIISTVENTNISIDTKVTDINNKLQVGVNTINLDKGESFSYNFGNKDISGINISSDKNILVLSGAKVARTSNTCCLDHIFHIEYPEEFLENQYILLPFAGRNKKDDYYKILSLEDENKIRINNNEISLNKNQFIDKSTGIPLIINADKNISITQYAKSGGIFGGIGDPFKINLLPISQMCKDINFDIIPSNKITDNFHYTVLKYKGDECYVNDSLLTDFTDLPNTEFEYKYVKADINTYKLFAKKGALVTVYGFSHADSYGYLAGACFEKIDPKFYINDSLSKSIICYDEGLTIRAESEAEIESLEWTVNDTLVLNGNPADFSMLIEPGFYNIKLILNENERQVSFYEIQRLAEIEIELEDSMLVCKDEVYEVEANITGDGSMTYTWTPNDNLLNANGYKVRFKEPVTEEITLFLDVISEYGCTQRDSIRIIPVNKIDLNIPEEITICRNDIITEIDYPNVRYQYFDVDGNLYYDSNVFSNDILHETMIIIEQTNESCFFYDTTMIYINELPVIDTDGFPIAACPDTYRDYEIPQDDNIRINWKVTNGKIIDSYDAEALNNDSTYMTNGKSARIFWDEPGTGIVELEILDLTTNCSNTVTELIPINNQLNPTIKANGVLVYDTVNVCFGEEMLLDAGVDFDEYYWYKEIFDQDGTPYSTEREISIDQEGLYIVNVYNELACIGLDSIYVRIYDLPNISAGNDTSICYNTSTTLKATGGVSYTWYLDGSVISEADTVFYDYLTSNSLELVGIDENGCVNYDTVEVEVFDEVEIKLIDEYFICENEILVIDNLEVLGVDGVKEVNWSSDNNLNTIVALSDNNAEVKAVENGSYSVEIIDNNDCVHFATFEVYIQKISTQLDFKDEVCFDETQVINARIINKVINQKKNSIALVLDISKDMNPQNMYLSKLGAKSFLDLLDRDRVEVCLITFDEYVYLEQEFTNDFGLLRTKIDNLKQNSGSNFDAALLDFSISAIPYITNNAQNEVRDIVFFAGSNSAVNSTEVISECNSNNITFHSMLVGNLENTTLESISQQTGGVYLPNISDQNEVVNKYREVFNSTIVNPFTYQWTSNEIDLSEESGDRIFLSDFEEDLRNVTIDLLVTDTITDCFHDTTLSFKINPLPTFTLTELNDVCIGDTAIFKLTIDSLYDEYSIEWLESDTGPLIIDENDSTIIRFVRGISNRFSVEINDSVSCVASQEYEYNSAKTQISFQVEDIVSSPKVFNQKIKINTTVDSARCITDETFILYISLNSKIFNPISIESDEVDLEIVKEFNLSELKWMLKVELSPDDIINDEIYIIGDAILADAYSYPVEIDSVEFNFQTTEVEVTNGSITLDEICEEGESRLLDYSNFFNILNSFPNPTSESVTIEVLTSDIDAVIRVECSDYLGRKFEVPFTVNELNDESKFNRLEVNANLVNLNSGMYRLTISNDKFNKTIKVIKK